MKRVTMVVLIGGFTIATCAGCYDVEIDKLTGLPVSEKVTEVVKQNKEPIKATQIRGPRGWQGDWDMYTKLSLRIAKLESDLLKAEPMQIEEALLARISDLESALELQRAEIENLKNTFRLYEVAVESQKLTIETLQKLCRLYEAKEQSIF